MHNFSKTFIVYYSALLTLSFFFISGNVLNDVLDLASFVSESQINGSLGNKYIFYKKHVICIQNKSIWGRSKIFSQCIRYLACKRNHN